MHTEEHCNPYLIHVVTLYPISCISIWTGGTLETCLCTNAHVLSETGPSWALSQRLRLHNNFARTWIWSWVGWTASKTYGHT